MIVNRVNIVIDQAASNCKMSYIYVYVINTQYSKDVNLINIQDTQYILISRGLIVVLCLEAP